MKHELKPCPWCKDTLPLEIKIELCSCQQHSWIHVSCLKCGAQGPNVIYREKDDRDTAEKKAAEWWNEGLK